MAKRYLALIGDLVASRSADTVDRRRIQARLAELFAGLDPAEHPGIAAQPLVTLGDEFQGLLVAAPAGVSVLMSLLPELVEQARPLEVRFGLGHGELSTELQPRALGIDGPCFHRAREALTRARDHDLLCQLETGAAGADAVWGALASYALRARTDWTEAQREAIALYEQLGAWSKVAQALEVTRGAISLRQRAAGWPMYRHAWDALGVELVERLTGKGGGA